MKSFEDVIPRNPDCLKTLGKTAYSEDPESAEPANPYKTMGKRRPRKTSKSRIPENIIKPVVYEEFLSWHSLENFMTFSKNDQNVFFKLARVENLKNI